MIEKLFRQALEWAAGHHDEDVLAAADHILATTDPLTMADVEWDDEKHHLAGATLPNGEEVVMMWPDTYGTGNIIAKEGEWTRDRLTPNGKRYELVEFTDKQDSTDTPTHPATLTTEQDYANAPKGTIVDIDGTVAVRGEFGWYSAGYEGRTSSEDMFHLGEGDVIRWGKNGEPAVSSGENVDSGQPEHPATLETQADYEKAPAGTVVALNLFTPWTKKSDGRWESGTSSVGSDDLRLSGPHTVLRWGWVE